MTENWILNRKQERLFRGSLNGENDEMTVNYEKGI